MFVLRNLQMALQNEIHSEEEGDLTQANVDHSVKVIYS